MKWQKDNVIVVTVFTVIGALLVSIFSPVFSPLHIPNEERSAYAFLITE